MAWQEGVESLWARQGALPQHQAQNKGQVRSHVRGGGSQGDNDIAVAQKP